MLPKAGLQVPLAPASGGAWQSHGQSCGFIVGSLTGTTTHQVARVSRGGENCCPATSYRKKELPSPRAATGSHHVSVQQSKLTPSSTEETLGLSGLRNRTAPCLDWRCLHHTNCPTSSAIFCFLSGFTCLFFWCWVFWTEGLSHARRVLCHWPPSLALFFSVHFWGAVSLRCICRPWTCNPPA